MIRNLIERLVLTKVSSGNPEELTNAQILEIFADVLSKSIPTTDEVMLNIEERKEQIKRAKGIL